MWLVALCAALLLVACGDSGSVTAVNNSQSEEDAGGEEAECSLDEDCDSRICNAGFCAEAACNDGVRNGGETDTDCGGPDCEGCFEDAKCAEDSDCLNGVCLDGTCAPPPSCTDSLKNQDETDVDCGGSTCPGCAADSACSQDSDCKSEFCDAGACSPPPSCTDQEQNADETDVDCGGSCSPCASGKACSENADCQTNLCENDTCAKPATCDDGIKNQDETDIDCGGSTCDQCAESKDCQQPSDCVSGVCNAGSCAAPSCTDNVLNGDETGQDCGGATCDGCPKGGNCDQNSDCASLNCSSGGTCAEATCDDGIKNQGEADVDCGGPSTGCGRCDLGSTCTDNLHCTSGLCEGQDGKTCAECSVGDTQKTSTTCGYADRGVIEQTCPDNEWVDGACVDLWYQSCWQYLQDNPSASDGQIEIDPDGPNAGTYKPFFVSCDMTKDNGGWTCLTRSNAHNDLGATMKAEDGASTNGIDSNDRPYTQDDVGDHTYHYTIPFPAGFDQFYLDNYAIRAFAASGDTSDLGYTQTSWDLAFVDGGAGDISFGAPGSGPIASYHRQINQIPSSKRSCNSCTIDWPLNKTTYDFSQNRTKFRVGWGEAGGQYEGWYPWYKGRICVR